MKKIVLGLFILVFSLITFNNSVVAKEPFGQEIRDTISETVETGKNEGSSPSAIRKEVRENIREQVQERKEGLLEKVKNFLKKNLRFNARITGTIASIGTTNTMTVTGDDGKTYTVNITDETRLVRRFGGKSELSEFSEGDKINVFGKFTDDNKLIINAKLIRNISIQKRWGAFFGEVTVKNSDNFVIKTIERGDQTVYFGSSKFLNHKKEIITYSDIKLGDRVRIKGVWDKTLNKISEVDEVRVFSPTPTKAPKPTGTNI